jgi:hypothetical protein
MIERLRSFRAAGLLLAAALLPCLGGCLDGGTEIPNELRGRVYTPSGTPAAFAEVTLYDVDYTPGQTEARGKVQVRADSSGWYRFKKIRNGAYNVVASGGDVLAYADSIVLRGGRVLERSDTLREAGAIAGTVKLQPQHDPRNAIVQILGTDYYENVSESGRFVLDDLPPGVYRLRVFTQLPDYVPLFRRVTVRAGAVDTLAEPLEPFYSGVPVVQGLKATPDSTGVIRLSWNKSAYSKTESYLIYRDPVGSTTLSTTPYRRVQDTVFNDTLYAVNPRSGQFAYLDSNVVAYTYRVRILDNSDNIGGVLGSVTTTSVAPARSYVSNRWRRATESAAFFENSTNVANIVKGVVFQNKLAIFHAWKRELWLSSDGATWEKASNLPIPAGTLIAAAVNYKGTLWVMTSTNTKNGLWASNDGVNWLKTADSLPLPTRTEARLLEFQDRMWLIGGSFEEYYHNGPQLNISRIHSSTDGVTWTDAAPEGAFTGMGYQAGAVFADRLWLSGGNADGHRGYNLGDALPLTHLASSPNGKQWVSAARASHPFDWMPRAGHGLLAHAGDLWAVAGRTRVGLVATSEVWRSTDGNSWNLVDANAPFAPRSEPAVLSLNGRLWVIGGFQSGHGGLWLSDVWYMQE